MGQGRESAEQSEGTLDASEHRHIVEKMPDPLTRNSSILLTNIVSPNILGLEPWELEQQPRRRRPALARRIITYLWVQKFNQPQIEVVRHFCLSTSTASRWYSKAVREINKTEPLCDAIISRLPVTEGPTNQNDNEARMRFNLHLDKEE
jgi:hypothetical protein